MIACGTAQVQGDLLVGHGDGSLDSLSFRDQLLDAYALDAARERIRRNGEHQGERNAYGKRLPQGKLYGERPNAECPEQGTYDATSEEHRQRGAHERSGKRHGQESHGERCAQSAHSEAKRAVYA